MITKKQLIRYIKRGLTVWNIVDIEKVCRNTVIKWMKKHKLDTPRGFFSKGLPLGRPPGIPMSEDQKEIRRKMFSGTGNPFHGKAHSGKTRKQMRKNHADFRGERNPFRKSLRDPKKREAHKARCQALWDARDSEFRQRFGERRKTGYQEITGTFWARVKHNAKTRGLSVEITMEDAWDVFVKQRGLCALSGVPIWFGAGAITTASLDRIDSSRPYTLNNIQWVHKTVNLMKGKISQEDFVFFCIEVFKCQNN